MVPNDTGPLHQHVSVDWVADILLDQTCHYKRSLQLLLTSGV